MAKIWKYGQVKRKDYKTKPYFSQLLFAVVIVRNDVTVLGRGGQGFCDNSTKALVIKRMATGERVKKCPKLRDVIYEKPLLQITIL